MNLGVPTAHVSYRIVNNRRVNVEQGLLRFFSKYSFFFYKLKFRHKVFNSLFVVLFTAKPRLSVYRQGQHLSKKISNLIYMCY